MFRSSIIKFRPLSSSFETLFLTNRRNVSAGTTTATNTTATVPETISKELLMKLRKETGYSYAKCRTALKKYGEQNLVDAKKWLKETAAKEGWEKAAKVSSRVTSQGLFGVVSEGNIGVAVEVRCETDFVARSTEFKKLVEEITLSVFEYGKLNPKQTETDQFIMVEADPMPMKTENNRSVEEAVAMTIGKLGENITVTKAIIFFSKSSVNVYGHTHPIDQLNNVKMGRLVSFVGMQRESSPATTFPSDKLANQICQHIIGMVPDELGKPLTDEEKQMLLEKQKKQSAEQENGSVEGEKEKSETEKLDEELNAFAQSDSVEVDENEKALLRQSFMLNPSQSVHEYLVGHGAQVTDFKRIELGQSAEEQ